MLFFGLKTNVIVYTQLLFNALSFFNQANGRVLEEHDPETTTLSNIHELSSSGIAVHEEFTSMPTTTNKVTPSEVPFDLVSTKNALEAKVNEPSPPYEFDDREPHPDTELLEIQQRPSRPVQMFGMNPTMANFPTKDSNSAIHPTKPYMLEDSFYQPEYINFYGMVTPKQSYFFDGFNGNYDEYY
ncbi:unnamed protein product [Rotaria magnacalcarata]|uniref:Uncharacterized protein n=2 Tax=Rotaria magnacalcarata TaxID=392030 RepID=A0A814EJZ8_9BILA|nr:unnamed protein product [Rotaria magnacalcarata]CAF2007511.1 unnamed protein product [Rotaria magnacalcarata]CAF3779711.1 unnamed protein product [Rotaria magnacalcarata]